MKNIFINKMVIIEKISFFLFILILIYLPKATRAQRFTDVSLPAAASQYCYPDSRLNLLHFREGNPLKAASFFRDHKEITGLKADDEMRLSKSREGQAGIMHYRFNQYYRNVPVEYISYTLHEKNGELSEGLGKIVRGVDMNVTPGISEETAIQTALQAVPATRYYWDDPKMEARLKDRKSNGMATYYPDPELVIARVNPNDDPLPEHFKLMYKVPVLALQPRQSMMVYIDALTGEMIRKKSNETACSPGSANTTFNGTHTVYTVADGSNFESTDDCVYSILYSYDEDGDLFTDGDNNWTSSSNEKQMAISSLWAVREATNYFAEVHDLIGFDGEGDFVEIYNNVSWSDQDCEGCNASWDRVNDNMSIGYGNTHSSILDDYNTIDICGHELTHGVSEESSGIDGDGISGAINESFADIFGNMIEYWVEDPLNSDATWWGIAEDRSGPDIDASGFRNMANPNEDLDPDTYLGDNWEYDTDNNSAYVHTNNGVGNFAFYLMSEGGSDVNDNGFTYNVQGITHQTARFIAFDAMVFYADADPNYEDIRDAYLTAAKMLYGNCSQEHITVGKAWEAVGVGNYDADYGKSICGILGELFPENIGAIYEVRNAVYDVFTAQWIPGSCSATIENNFPVSVHASGEISIGPGFEVKSGGDFSAYLNSCDITYYKIDAPSSDPDIIIPSIEETKVSGLTIYPNPTSVDAAISFHLSEKGVVSVSVVDINNRVLLQPITNEIFDKGKNQVAIDVAKLAAGVYQVILSTGHTTEFQKLIVLRQ